MSADPTRQGGSNLGSLPKYQGVSLTTAEAADHADRQKWRTIRSASLQSEITLADALARAIGCPKGDWRGCRQYPWMSCCAARMRACDEEPAT